MNPIQFHELPIYGEKNRMETNMFYSVRIIITHLLPIYGEKNRMETKAVCWPCPPANLPIYGEKNRMETLLLGS